MLMSCPHCHTNMRLRSSRRLTDVSKELYWQCLNLACAFSASSVLELTRTIAPASEPNPRIALPRFERGTIPRDMLIPGVKPPDERQTELPLTG